MNVVIAKLKLENSLFDNQYRSNDEFRNDVLKGYEYVGLFIGGKLVSFLSYFPFEEVLEINYLVTKQECLRKGYASQLMDDFLRANKDFKIWLEVNSNNQGAINLYLKKGFIKSGYRPNYYSDGDAILLTKEACNE